MGIFRSAIHTGFGPAAPWALSGVTPVAVVSHEHGAGAGKDLFTGVGTGKNPLHSEQVETKLQINPPWCNFLRFHGGLIGTAVAGAHHDIPAFLSRGAATAQPHQTSRKNCDTRSSCRTAAATKSFRDAMHETLAHEHS
jgi:hypothetical protein